MNKWMGTGNLVADPEFKVTASGKRYAKYTLAVNRWTRSKGRQTDFFECVLFGKAVDFAEKFLFKGRKIFVEGTLTTDTYTDKDGKKVRTFNIMVDSHELLTFEERPKDSPMPEGHVQDNDFFTKLAEQPSAPDEFIQVPDDVGDEGLPFN